MNTVEHLEAGKALVEQGWMQHHSANDDETRFCAIGALAKAVNWNASLVNMRNGHATTPLLALDAVAEHRGFPSIQFLNDAPRTTKADVIDAFNEAIRDEKAKTAEPLPSPIAQPVAPVSVAGTLISYDTAAR